MSLLTHLSEHRHLPSPPRFFDHKPTVTVPATPSFASKQAMPKFPYEEFLFAAKNVLNALDDVGEPWCCLVGGMAAKLLGADHEVDDLDILVLSPDLNPLALKTALQQLQPNNFFLKKPQNPDDTFMLLKYCIPGTSHIIKIDLLHSTEPTVEIPRYLSHRHFVYVNGLPVAPLYFVLYHKLLGWTRNLHASKFWKRKKARTVDYTDIINLCSMAKRQGVRPLSKSHMGRHYLDNFHKRALKFTKRYGNDAENAFRQLGFRV